MRKVLHSASLLATALPLYAGGAVLQDRWFFPIGVVILAYGVLAVATHLIPWRHPVLKGAVVLANVAVAVSQVWQLFFESTPQGAWMNLLALGYALLTSASVLLLPRRGSFLALLSARNG